MNSSKKCQQLIDHLYECVLDKSSIVKRFQTSFAVEKEMAENLLTDCLLFLWVSEQFQQKTGKSIPIISGQEIIDEMWHNFILFTKQYHHFCHQVFGKYIHHQPNTNDEPFYDNTPLETIASYVDFISETVGEAISRRWYIDIPSLSINVNKLPI